MKPTTQQITLVALFLSFCIVVPIIFHLFGAGVMFLPMFLPILLSGFLIRFPMALVVGLLGPWVSAVTTGMPPIFPIAPIMSFEGLAAVGIVSYFYHNRKMSFWFCLIAGIVAERLALALMIILMVLLLDLPPKILTLAGFVHSLPGVVVQLILIPIIWKTLMRLNVVEQKS